MKVLAYLSLLAALVGLTWLVPILWELAVVAAIGGAYWIFFRIPEAEN